VAHERFAERLKSWGERPDRVYVVGAPALDAAHCLTPLEPAALARSLGRERLGTPLVLLTHHPTTLGELSAAAEVAAVLDGVRTALAAHPDALVVMTAANVDTGGAAINAALRGAAAADPHRFELVESLGARRYHSMMALADVMVGNSSSGILEAPTYDLPVVNVGDRQRGRLRVGRVADVPVDAGAVGCAVRAVTDVLTDPVPSRTPRPARPTAYGDGRAAHRLLAVLHAIADEPELRRLVKEHAPVPLHAEG
jgi:UDP-hydrolysing UDP-N-acetyl-D-glucosamine 2-epimerase